ncbi:MAG: MFS transporter, partial [Paracoccaceae bacterium]
AGIATFVLMGAAQSIYGPAMPALARTYELTLGTAGLVVSAHWIGCFAGVGVMYLLGRHITPRHVLAAMALGALVIAAGLGWAITLLGAGLFGMGYGGATVVFNPRVLTAFGARGPGMLSLLNACFGIGAIAAPLVFVALGSQPALSFGLIAILCALVWLTAGRTGEATTTPPPTGPFRPDWLILTFGALAIAIEALLIGLGPAALIAAGESEARAAQLLSLFFVTYLGARVALVFTAHLVAPFTLFTAATLTASALAAAAALIHPAIFFVGIGACTGLLFPGFYITAQRRMGDDPRTTPTIIAAGLVGGITAPLVMTGILESLGERGFFWIIAIKAALITATALTLRHRITNEGPHA